MDDRRQFDRVQIPASANIFAETPKGVRLGRVLILGRGGCLLQSTTRFPGSDTVPLVIVAEQDGVRRQVSALPLYTTPDNQVGLEFHNVEPDAAVELGVLVGKYFSAAASTAQ